MTDKGQRLGYIRVSTVDQKTDRQLDGIELDRVFSDHASGKSADRPQLLALLQYAREGDTVIVHSMDRLARNVDDLRRIVLEQVRRGIRVHFIKENLTFAGDDSPMAHLMLTVLGAVAQFERDLIKERQREGIALAKERGAYRGRSGKLSEAQIEEISQRLRSGEGRSKLAREFGVTRQTTYRHAPITCSTGDSVP